MGPRPDFKDHALNTRTREKGLQAAREGPHCDAGPNSDAFRGQAGDAIEGCGLGMGRVRHEPGLRGSHPSAPPVGSLWKVGLGLPDLLSKGSWKSGFLFEISHFLKQHRVQTKHVCVLS